MQLHIRHETVYRYDHPVKHSIQNLRLTPRTEPCQRVLTWNIAAPGRQAQQVDALGNVMLLLTMDEPHDEIRIVVGGTVETMDAPNGLLADDGRLSPLAYVTETTLTQLDAPLRRFASAHGSARPTRGQVLVLAGAIRDTMEYDTEATSVTDTATHAFSLRRGVCQDHAHVFIAACRQLGVPARYVSGYLARGEGTNPTTASHAWAEALVPDLGWVSFDCANGLSATEAYVRVAVGLDYADAGPVRGVRTGSGVEELDVTVKLSPKGALASEKPASGVKKAPETARPEGQ